VLLPMMSGPSTLGSLGLHISVSNWLCLVRWHCSEQTDSHILCQIRSRSMLCALRMFQSLIRIDRICEERRMVADCRNWLPCLLVRCYPLGLQLYRHTLVYRPLLPFQKQGPMKVHISCAVNHKNGFIFCCVGRPKKTHKLWLKLFVADHVITTSAIDNMHITQVIVYSNFIKIISGIYGIFHPKFLEHGDFLVTRFLHNFEHHA
jgi:hypothetical protein